jgi:hypothetical protein
MRAEYTESLGMDEVILKDLALKFRSLREADRIGRRVCLKPFKGELRSRREERNLSGVKNLLGTKTFPKIHLCNHGFEDTSLILTFLESLI